jgi:hypothetical protein
VRRRHTDAATLRGSQGTGDGFFLPFGDNTDHNLTGTSGTPLIWNLNEICFTKYEIRILGGIDSFDAEYERDTSVKPNQRLHTDAACAAPVSLIVICDLDLVVIRKGYKHSQEIGS